MSHLCLMSRKGVVVGCYIPRGMQIHRNTDTASLFSRVLVPALVLDTGLAAKQITNIVHNNTRTFWNFRGEMFITRIFNYAFWYVSEINSVTVMISVLTVGKLRLTDLVCPQPPFCDCWAWALSPPPLAQPPRAVIATSVSMRRFYLTERLL